MRCARTTSPLSAALLFALAACVDTELVDETFPARIDLSPASASVQVGQTLRLDAVHYNSSGAPVDGTLFEWISSEPEVASVDAGGLVVGLAAGQTTITALAGEVSSNPAVITVVEDPSRVASVEVSPAYVRLSPGQTQLFTAVARDLAGTPVSPSSLSWRSDDPAVASIGADGTASALAPGSARIVATADGVDSAPAALEIIGGSRSGTFTGNPFNHYSVSGSATLREGADGSLILDLGADFASSAGPGLYVYLSTFSGVGSVQSRSLGRLQSFSGAQTYAVPTGVGLYTYSWVVIHCVPYNVTFGYALLE